MVRQLGTNQGLDQPRLQCSAQPTAMYSKASALFVASLALRGLAAGTEEDHLPGQAPSREGLTSEQIGATEELLGSSNDAEFERFLMEDLPEGYEDAEAPSDDAIDELLRSTETGGRIVARRAKKDTGRVNPAMARELLRRQATEPRVRAQPSADAPRPKALVQPKAQASLPPAPQTARPEPQGRKAAPKRAKSFLRKKPSVFGKLARAFKDRHPH